MPGPEPLDSRRWLLSGDLPCLGCTYNLRGLVGPLVRCPECGHVNDLRDAAAWRMQDLPLGVREREHWPATAVMWSFGAAVSGLFFVVFLQQSTLPIVPGVIFAALGFAWVWNCRRWLKSVRHSGWGWLVVIGVHAGAWAILLGVVFAAVSESLWPLALSPCGMAGLIAMRGVIRRADEAGQFRQDWRQWQLPLGHAEVA